MAHSISDKLHEKDEEIRACCDVKNKLMIELLRVYSDNDEQHNVSKIQVIEGEGGTADQPGHISSVVVCNKSLANAVLLGEHSKCKCGDMRKIIPQ